MKALTVKFDDRISKEILKLLKEEGYHSQSDVIREAVVAYVRSKRLKERARQVQAYSAAKKCREWEGKLAEVDIREAASLLKEIS